MTKLIVILGITGKQGGAVASHFLTLPHKYTIRGLTRSPTSPRALSLLSTHPSLTLQAADLNDPSTLPSAFSGASIIFITTDFWAPYYDPSTTALLTPGQSLGEYCYETEMQQMKNVLEAAANVEGLERVVVSSLVDAGRVSEGKYKGIWHWDGKARGVEWGLDRFERLRGMVSTVVVGNYMENWRGDVRLRKQEDGSYHVGLVGSGTVPLPHLDVGGDLGKIAEAAINNPPGLKILAAGDMISWSDQLKVLCEESNVPFGGFDSLPIEVFDKFFPIPGLGRELGEMMAFMDEHGYAGGDPDVIMPGQLENPPRLTTWEEYVKKHEWNSILNP